ncbi:MAG: heme biosynthesis protein HemY [Micavibrio aeruginosavorus]|uniref:Heme biosynthesis protein HemY n=1 Tax=Micavibrio aeruginosavorus TaxID=349221 RepID=A0A2W5MVE5_9BACT|nr:MAG: heme biosynthesis protein HemY [Micavibrio aeruginosavorus]
MSLGERFCRVFRALWFFIQLAVVVCAAIWIATQKGVVDIVWNNYSISLQLGIFLLGLTLFLLAALSVFRLIGTIVSLPKNFSRNRQERARAKGFQSLTRGFVAIAAGDAKKATQYAKEVRNLLPDERGLPLLLEAQAARLRGEESAARISFEKLLEDKDAAFFGVRGLLKSSLDEGDSMKALGYAKAALEQNPKQPWILKSVYDLELQNRQWEAASRTLDKVKRHKVLDIVQANSDEVALLLLLAEQDRLGGDESACLKKIERAVKIDPTFVPAVVRLAEYYLSQGKSGKVSSLVERAWRINPHPELIALWDRIAPETKASDPMRRMRWFEKLVAIKPDSADGQIAAAKVAMEAGLWGEAKAYLTVAENLRPSSQVFRVRADLEDLSTKNAASVKYWLEKAAQATPDPVWYCSLTGHIYESWSPVAEPHGSFNTIKWGHPLLQPFGTARSMMGSWKDPLLIDNA